MIGPQADTNSIETRVKLDHASADPLVHRPSHSHLGFVDSAAQSHFTLTLPTPITLPDPRLARGAIATHQVDIKKIVFSHMFSYDYVERDIETHTQYIHTHLYTQIYVYIYTYIHIYMYVRIYL